ncbi:hypothetical protein M758_2G228000 [Ceratodon purpureus]|nr:hypothetical protein M758_2G228000 [Ceratodon purpureus]
MPAVLPMRSVGAGAKARTGGARGLARAKSEQGREEGAVVAMKGGSTVGLLSSQLRACAAAGSVVKGAESDGERIRSKLFGNGVDVENRFGNQYMSSGSEHELNSVCLGAMVDRFMEDEVDSGRSVRSRCSCKFSGSMCECDFDEYRSSLGGELSEILQDLVPSANVTERMLLGEVNKAIAVASDVVAAEGGVTTCLRRQVMKHLRTGGYNAAICKSRWEHVGNFPGGDYEYIDVVFEGATGKSERIMIDIEFRAQFEIARPSSSYNAVVQVLPAVFVGKADRLFQIVNIMSDAVKQSLKKSGLDLPPWRKPEYMRAKWFSSYRRTTNDTVHKAHGEDMANNISRIAVRDQGWNARYTEEMEVDYLRVGERRAMKDLKNLIAKKPTEVVSTKAAAVPAVVNNSDWTPPALKPRVFQRRGQAGLASILREAGLTSSIRSLIEEQRMERKSLPIAV